MFLFHLDVLAKEYFTGSIAHEYANKHCSHRCDVDKNTFIATKSNPQCFRLVSYFW